MNYYERIQRAIDYIDEHLDKELKLEDVSKAAFMSQANLYRMFFALTGYTVKTYIRNRRFAEAYRELKIGKGILDTALKYGFSSHEAFTRSFHKVTGMAPSSVKMNQKIFCFERKNIMEQYFDIQDEALLEKYPDIKVLKELKPMRVAYYCYYGKNPEQGAWKVIANWLRRSGLKIEKDGLRFFGFNNPNPMPEQEEYGYEIWVTIKKDLVVEDKLIREKNVSGGLYVVTSVNGGAENIYSTWQRVSKWLLESPYTYGGHQWLEEHLDFDEDFSHLGGIDLYIPIELIKDLGINKEIVNVESMQLLCMRFEGPNAIDEARSTFLSWLKDKQLIQENSITKVIAWYNPERIGKSDHFCEIGIPYEGNNTFLDERIKLVGFTGGEYAIEKSRFKRLGYEWEAFIKWIQSSTEYTFGMNQFFEEYQIEGNTLEMETEIHLYMPIVKK